MVIIIILAYDHCNKSKISCSLRLRKCVGNMHYIIEQISGSLHEIRLCHVHFPDAENSIVDV